MNKRDRFERAMEDLVVMATKSGFDTQFNIHSGKTAAGLFHQNQKIIEISFGITAPNELILFVTAHEIRHMQHYQLGLYKDYYREEHEDQIGHFNNTDDLRAGYLPPKPCVAIRAESDCNKWAVRFMKDRGFHYDPAGYAICDVMGYGAFIRYQTIKRERSKAAPCDQGAAC